MSRENISQSVDHTVRIRTLCSGHRRQYEAESDYYSGYTEPYDQYYYNYYQGRSLQDSFQHRMGSLVKRYSASHCLPANTD